MSLDAELIIIGGGCAGLSLASRLAERDTHCPRIIILESRTHYTHDRTWCFWGHDALRATARVRHLIPHQWRKVRVSGHVRGSARTTTMDGGDHAYQMLPADVFYADALRMIAKNNRIDLRLGHAIITEPVKNNKENAENGPWQIETSHGLIRGARIIDTRPVRRPERGGALLWQSFYGQEITCAEPVFETEYVDLMDFSEPRAEQIAFTYVLPLSPHRALIEATVFAIDPLSPDALVVQLEAAIAQRLHGAAFSVVRSEHGILPMGMIPAAAVPPAPPAPLSPLNHDLSYIKVGLTAGGARPATGYAFQRIQRWADLCASAIMAGKPLVTHPPDPLLLRMMDRLFLQVIRAHPALAPELFLLIFERVDPNRLIRFLSDRGTFADYIAIIRALPPGPFLGQIVSRIRGAFGLHQDPRHS